MRPSGERDTGLTARRFNRLSVKVFLISFFVQILSGFLICLVLYSQTPEMIYSPKDELDDLIEILAETPRSEADAVIDDFISRTGMDLAFFDGSKYISHRYNMPLGDIGTLTIKTMQDYIEVMERLDTEGNMGMYGVHFKDDDTDYFLQYFDYGDHYNVVPRALHKSLPLIIVVVVSLSLVSSLIYTFLFARPVRQLSSVSGRMAKMDFTAKCDTRRGDEIGDLARDLNTLSSELDSKIRELEGEITRVKEMESQKEVFFAAASHELKTPVTILEGHIRGMIEGIGPYEDHDEYLARSLRTVKRMESLINEILTASKTQSSDDIVLTTVDMSSVLNKKLEESEELMLIRGITVNKDIGSDLLFEGNADLTALAVGAFISNAVFYSVEGSVVDVTAAREDGRIVVRIRNNGAHIDEKDLPHLFEPFYRSDSSRSSRDGGSGLGLYIANLVITKQHGTATLINEDDAVLAEIILPST